MQGPLTTTYTAPSSCSTSYNQIAIGQNLTDDESHSTFFFPTGNPCGPASSIGNCVPSGTALDQWYTSWEANPDPRSAYRVDYYSPGLVCPSGYATVGSATKLDGGAVTSSGPGFVLSTALPTNAVWLERLQEVAPNVLLQAMDEEETAILCCPRYEGPPCLSLIACSRDVLGANAPANNALLCLSGFEVDVNGVCSSALPSDVPIPTTVCERIADPDDYEFGNKTLTMFGTTFTGTGISVTGSVPYNTSTVTLTSLAPTDATDTATEYVVMTYQAALYLVHAPSDTGTSSGSGPTSTGSGGASNGTSSSAASSLLQGVGIASAGALFAVVTAFASGFALMLY